MIPAHGPSYRTPMVRFFTMVLLLTAAVAPAAEDTLRSTARRVLGTPDPADIPWPSGVPAPAEEIALGERLFHAPALSRTGTIACATCHDPRQGFADGHVFSRGVAGTLLPRHTPTIANLAWTPLLFWDGRAESLEDQALGPLVHPAEMGLAHEDIAIRARTVTGRADLGTEDVLRALAAYQRTLVTIDTPFDRWLAGAEEALEAPARRGLALFLGPASCVTCHSGPLLSDHSFHAIGLDSPDPGRGAIVPGAAAAGAMKVPGLRNVARTAPYFHDGSAATLEEVVRFYDRGGDRPPGTPLISPRGFSAQDRADLVAFLRSVSLPAP